MTVRSPSQKASHQHALRLTGKALKTILPTGWLPRFLRLLAKRKLTLRLKPLSISICSVLAKKQSRIRFRQMVKR
ncbi:hypothetical protein FQZ97_990560 [compost metagenome]